MSSTRQFHATAINAKGYTFVIYFQAYNWHGIEAIAQARLDEVVAADALHQANGPWRLRGIDVG